MVPYKMRERRFLLTTIAAIGLIALGVGVGGSAQRPAQEPNQRLQELMTERYEILRDMVASLEIFFNSGRIDLFEWRDANVALFKAKADLAADASEQIKVYEELVDFLRDCEQKARQRVDAGRASEADVQRSKLATIEAQMVIEKLRMPQIQ